MRNLHLVNQAAKSTAHVFTISLVIPFFLGWIVWALATGASSSAATTSRILSAIGPALSLVAIIALPLPYIFRWDWEVKYFGAATFAFASGALIGLFPIACIICYAAVEFWWKVTIVVFEIFLNIWWCSRFVSVYRKIHSCNEYCDAIYEEDSDAIYYVRQVESRILKSKLKFDEVPRDKFFLISTAAAFMLVPFAASVSKLFGIPFIHVFIAVLATPINLLFLGLGMKGVLAFYIYPSRLRRLKNKRIYIDMSSAARKIC